MTNPNPVMMRTIMAVCMFCWLLWAAPSAEAHKVSVFAWVEVGQVHTESKFSGGKRVNAGKIEVFDHQEQLVHTGKTNQQGYHGFAAPAGAKQLRIVLTAGSGHANEWVIRAEELGVAQTGDHTHTVADTREPPSAAATESTSDLNTQAIETIVERALERKLAPIRSQLAEQSWGLRDIVAGVGYILGLMGLASYLHFRKQSAANKMQ